MTKDEEIIVGVVGAALLIYFLAGSEDAEGSSTPANVQAGSKGTVYDLAKAIATEEGFFAKGASPNVPQRANNPLDLENGDIGYGTITAADGQKITIYPTLAAGWAAAIKQLTRDVTGGSKIYSPSMSISDFMKKFTGGSSTAGNTVAKNLGVSPSTPVGDY